MNKLMMIFLSLSSLVTLAAHADPVFNDTELKLVESLQAINNKRLDVALKEVDKLTKANPTFKLAHLVKGDLLMARAGEIRGIGSSAQAPNDQIQDLRDEARVHLQRILSKSDMSLTPKFLWKMDLRQKYALVVDTSRSTLFVYENVNGEPRYVADFYVTIGKQGTDKLTVGDQRTPIGVYFVQSVLPKKQLADLYGNGAFPLSYPNEWDHRNQRTGGGIWIHGTPSNTYTRPPRASNGCVALMNDDLDKLAPYLQAGVTPVIITKQMDWSNEQDQKDRESLQSELEQWRKDWASLNTDNYLTHYSPDFASGNKGFTEWSNQKHLVNSAKSWIKLSISDVSMFTYPDVPDMVVVDFVQDYSSNNLSNKMRKRQYWKKQDNTWKIIYEGAG